MAFLTLSMAEIFHAFNMRSLHGSIFKMKTQNIWLIGAGILSFVLTATVIEIDFLANAFSLANLNIREYGIALLLSITIIPIVEIVKATLEKTPPELASDIVEKGIVLAGGGALIKNLDKLLSQKTGMPVYIAESPLECVVKGTGKTLEDLERLKTVLINNRKRR